MNHLEYLIFIIPVVFILLSRKYMIRFNRLQGTGKIPNIIVARQLRTFFFCMAVVSSVLIVLVIKEL